MEKLHPIKERELMISLEDKIEVLHQLGQDILAPGNSERWNQVYTRAGIKNPWFTMDNVQYAMESIAKSFLNRDRLRAFVSNYDRISSSSSRKVGLVLAGNIPAVGFHDVLCTFLCNHISMIKYSGKDDVLIPGMLEVLGTYLPETSDYFESVSRLENFDAVIATGGNNTSRYFDYYFKKYPHIIRRSRNGIGVLTGQESEEEIMLLGKDIFSYFGLGCRNVSHLLVPSGYNLEKLMEVLHGYRDLVLHAKYKHNFDYSLTLYLINKEKFLNNGCLILRPSLEIASRISCVNYSYYETEEDVVSFLKTNLDKIQCVISRAHFLKEIETFPPGKSQSPSLSDFADSVDTIKFLSSL